MKPKIGQTIYVGTSWYIDHGEDDFDGGLCVITRVFEECWDEGKKKQTMVEVAERPGWVYNYNHLLGSQAKWKKQFGDQKGQKSPDYG